MSAPEGNSEFCFPESLNVSRDEVEGIIESRGKTKPAISRVQKTSSKHKEVYLNCFSNLSCCQICIFLTCYLFYFNTSSSAAILFFFIFVAGQQFFTCFPRETLHLSKAT